MANTTATKAERVREIKRECNHAKTGLIDAYRKLSEVSTRQAEQLGRIIARLEAWQNR